MDLLKRQYGVPRLWDPNNSEDDNKRGGGRGKEGKGKDLRFITPGVDPTLFPPKLLFPIPVEFFFVNEQKEEQVKFRHRHRSFQLVEFVVVRRLYHLPPIPEEQFGISVVHLFVPPVPLYTVVSILSTIVEHRLECRRDQRTQSSFAFMPFSKSWRCTTPRPASALVNTVAYRRQNVLFRTAYSRAPLPGVDARYLFVNAS